MCLLAGLGQHNECIHSYMHACIGLIFNSCIYLCVFAYASHTFPSVYHLPARCVSSACVSHSEVTLDVSTQTDTTHSFTS